MTLAWSGMWRFTWFDRAGKVLRTIGPTGRYGSVVLSPDQTRIATARFDPKNSYDIVIIDSFRGSSMRLTSDPALEGFPVWSPDGTRVAFLSAREGPGNMYQRLSNGAGNEGLLFKNANRKEPTDWNGDRLIYSEIGDRGKRSLWVLPMTGERKPVPYFQSEFNVWWGRFSPDGRWVAYTSDESSRTQIYVQSFPAGTAKSLISVDGGRLPRWRRDGKELYFLGPDGELMAVEVQFGSSFQAGTPKRLFKTQLAGAARYDVSADGTQFLVPVPTEDKKIGEITVVLNWTAELKP